MEKNKEDGFTVLEQTGEGLLTAEDYIAGCFIEAYAATALASGIKMENSDIIDDALELAGEYMEKKERYKQAKEEESVEAESQVDDPGSKEFQLGIMRNIEDILTKNERKCNSNWVLVMNYLLARTSKGGSISGNEHCRFLGVDPDGFTFY